MDSSRATCNSIQTAFTRWSESFIPIIISWLTAKEIPWKPCVFHSYKSAFMKEFVIGDIPYQIRILLVLHNVRYMIYQCLQLEKKNLLHYLHNRHLLMLPLKTTCSSGHCLTCWWLRRGATCWSANTVFTNGSESCYFMIDSHRCAAPWLQYPSNWWLRSCQRKHSPHWWVGTLYPTTGTSSKPKPHLPPKEGPVGLFPWQVLSLLMLPLMAIISAGQYLSCWCAPGRVTNML